MNKQYLVVKYNSDVPNHEKSAHYFPNTRKGFFEAFDELCYLNHTYKDCRMNLDHNPSLEHPFVITYVDHEYKLCRGVENPIMEHLRFSNSQIRQLYVCHYRPIQVQQIDFLENCGTCVFCDDKCNCVCNKFPVDRFHKCDCFGKSLSKKTFVREVDIS